jgi:hypothetical protein
MNSQNELSSKNKITVFKNNISDELYLDDINSFNTEKENIKKNQNTKKLILKKNKSKNNANINEQPQYQRNKQSLEGKIFNHNNSQFPSVFLKNLKLKKFKQKDKKKEIENILSSNRAFNISENENGKTDVFNYENNNRYDGNVNDDKDNENGDYQTYQTEEGFMENIEEMKISPEELYKKIIDINLDNKINIDELKLFFFNPIPNNETFVSNINIIYPDKNQNNIFNYNLEIITNNKIYYFAKIKKYFPFMIIKIYFSENYNKVNNAHFSQVSSFERDLKNNNSEIFCIGKIISNMMRNNFIVYSGNKKNNYIKSLEINYAINIFGLLGVREMKVDKYANNKVSLSFYNSKPEWDYQYNNYKMDFNGRVKQTSKKNFILVKDNKKIEKEDIFQDSENNILQCGKIDDKTYALDFISPLTPFEAFCISITSLSTKISCE